MKTAVIGTGKTGSKVLELLDKNEIYGQYNSKNKPSINELKECDNIIVFVPNNNLEELIDILINSGKPVIWGVTGYILSEEINRTLIGKNVPWVVSPNFSLGMNIIRDVLRILHGGLNLFENPVCKIHEVHHTKKKDAPSGTAILWNELLGKKATITSDRIGDVVGEHYLSIETEYEVIKLEHKAKDRKLFAQGAVWAARNILKRKDLSGLISFEDFTKEIIRGEL